MGPGVFCSEAVPVGEREEPWTSTAVQAAGEGAVGRGNTVRVLAVGERQRGEGMAGERPHSEDVAVERQYGEGEAARRQCG